MAGTATSTASESGGRKSFDGISSGQSCQSAEALAEFRSSEQVENGVPSTSPPYWDSDDDDDCGPKPSELYGKYTWKIDKFSQINKRELRSNAFEVGGYKWYILIYPQGCDVCNHLSLFLCVANHDKLLPGWSHFAQFTIAVVNKDPKKSKYSDTLHRFWKKEHDWGWKKFMELSKVLDGFIDADTLIIKAQVQVIRERADRPFRCLDCQYRRELVRVYLTNVEQICRRFVEERRVKLGKLTEDKARWSSFCAFWLEIDNNSRRRISREKMDIILRVVVKQFFIEKEVTSTLVMDSLYSGLKALEGQTSSKKSKGKLIDAEELPVPIVRIEKDTFVLVDDVLQLLERAAIEPLPPKDDKGPQNRTKDGGSAEDFSKDSIERDERRLTELGRRTIEIFVLAHLFSKIEVAHQEAVALKRQEELIREEAVWMAETEQKAKRCPTEKEKKSKKKQVKQKRINRKGKDKVKDDKPDVAVHDHLVQENSVGERNGIITEAAEYVLGRPDTLEDASDVSDSVDFLPEILQPDTDDRDASPVNWDTDTSDVYHPTVASHSELSSFGALQDGMRETNSQSVVDDSSSTCSTDSVLSVAINGPGEWNSLPNQKSQKSPSRGRNQRVRATSDSTVYVSEVCSQPPEVFRVAQPNDSSGSCKSETETEMVVRSLQERIKELEQHMVKKEEVEVSLRRELGTNDQVGTERPSKDKGTVVPSSLSSSSKNLPLAVPVKSASKTAGASDTERPSKDKGTGVPSSPSSSSKNLPSAVQVKSVSKTSGDTVFTRKPSSDSPPGEEISFLQINSTPKSDTQKAAVPEPTEKLSAKQVIVTSRPLTAPIIPGPRPIAPIVSMVQTTPLLERSVSAAGRLGPDLSPVTHSYVPLSYRNAITGTSVTASSAGFTQPQSPSSSMNPMWSSYATPAVSISSPVFLGRSSERMEPNSIKPTIPFEMLNRNVLQNGPHWTGGSLQRNSSRSIHYDSPSLHEDINDLYFGTSEAVHRRLQDHFPIEFPACASGSRSHELPACSSGRQSHGVSTDEFPHLDIINDLLNDEHGITKAAVRAGTSFQSFSNRPHHLNRQFTFPRDIGMLNDTGPSTSFGRFERTRSYQDDVFQRGHGSLGVHFDSLHDMVPQTSTRRYVDGQIDGSIPNQWQISGPDLSYLSLRNAEVDGYQYRFPDYPNLACRDNGYTVFPPSNGH